MTTLEQQCLESARSFFRDNRETRRERIASRLFAEMYGKYDHIPSDEQITRIAVQAVRAADILINEFDK